MSKISNTERSRALDDDDELCEQERVVSNRHRRRWASFALFAHLEVGPAELLHQHPRWAQQSLSPAAAVSVLRALSESVRGRWKSGGRHRRRRRASVPSTACSTNFYRRILQLRTACNLALDPAVQTPGQRVDNIPVHFPPHRPSLARTQLTRNAAKSRRESSGPTTTNAAMSESQKLTKKQRKGLAFRQRGKGKTGENETPGGDVPIAENLDDDIHANTNDLPAPSPPSAVTQKAEDQGKPKASAKRKRSTKLARPKLPRNRRSSQKTIVNLPRNRKIRQKRSSNDTSCSSVSPDAHSCAAVRMVNKIVTGNLKYTTSKETISKHFSACGEQHAFQDLCFTCSPLPPRDPPPNVRPADAQVSNGYQIQRLRVPRVYSSECLAAGAQTTSIRNRGP